MTNTTAARFLLLALLCGGSFASIKVLLEGLTPSQLVLGRLAIGAAFLIALVGVRRVRLPGHPVSGAQELRELLNRYIPAARTVSRGRRRNTAGPAKADFHRR